MHYNNISLGNIPSDYHVYPLFRYCYYCCAFAVAPKFSEIFCLVTPKCEGYSSGFNPSFIRAENIGLYFASSPPFMILAYSAICFPFVRSSEGRVSSETGTFTPAATIPFKHAAMRDVNESLPVYRIALSLPFARLFLPRR